MQGLDSEGLFHSGKSGVRDVYIGLRHVKVLNSSYVS